MHSSSASFEHIDVWNGEFCIVCFVASCQNYLEFLLFLPLQFIELNKVEKAHP